LPRFLFLAIALYSFPVFAQQVGEEEAPAEEQKAPQVTKAPKLSHFVEAEYPPDKKAAGVTASVLLSIEIGADGKVGNVTVAQ
jgi:outer membrane biosynthesis protein TonB